MIQSELIKTLELRLILNKEQAKYLKDLTQNYKGSTLEDEKSKRIRFDIFNAISCHGELK